MELFHRDLGGAGLPPLVVLHGLLGSSRNWQTAGRDLASRAHVLALDLRNHGASPHDPDCSYPAMVADVLAWLDRRDIGRTGLLGHSLGGKVAMALACRHPDRVARLAVADMAPKDYRGLARHPELAAMAALDLSTLRSRADAEARLTPDVPNWALRKFVTTNLDRDGDGRWRWAVNLEALRRSLPELEANPLAAEERYGGPALFVVGGRSPYVGEQDHAAIRSHFPAAKIEILPDSGHNPHMDAREDFARLVAAFLAGAD